MSTCVFPSLKAFSFLLQYRHSPSLMTNCTVWQKCQNICNAVTTYNSESVVSFLMRLSYTRRLQVHRWTLETEDLILWFVVLRDQTNSTNCYSHLLSEYNPSSHRLVFCHFSYLKNVNIALSLNLSTICAPLIKIRWTFVHF